MSTETLITIAIAAVLIPAAFVPYFRIVRRREREAHARYEKAKITGLQPAVALHPHIDALSCIGCGSCVRACPEDHVLGVVGGKAVLLNGQKCVGHGMCAEACPVGAITLMMAAPGRSADLPVLSATYETSVPGVYIVGELGGLGLIRNAIMQGERVVRHIAERQTRRNGIYDVAIVGAGPAGLAAGLTAKAAGLKHVVLEQGDIGGTILQYPRAKIVMTSPVDLPLWGKLKLTETSKEHLLEIWKRIIAKTGLSINTGEKVTDIQRSNGQFVLTSPGRSYEARTVVLALGRRGTPRKLGVPGEERGKVTYRLMDASSYQDRDILVVGGGDSAVEAALGLAVQGTNRVTLSYRGTGFTRIKERNAARLEEMRRGGTLAVCLASHVRSINEQSIELETAEGRKEVRNDYVFVFAGGEMPFDFLKSIGVQFHARVLS
jgi:putative YpdA family bacillithiol system oxidoreductase